MVVAIIALVLSFPYKLDYLAYFEPLSYNIKRAQYFRNSVHRFLFSSSLSLYSFHTRRQCRVSVPVYIGGNAGVTHSVVGGIHKPLINIMVWEGV